MKPSDLSQSISFTQSFLVSISPRGLRLVVGEKVDQGVLDLQTFLQTSKSRELRVEFSGTGGMLYCLCVLKYVLVWPVEILAPSNLWRATAVHWASIVRQLFQACCKHLIVPHSNLLDTHTQI